jgi:hypothetical protein
MVISPFSYFLLISPMDGFRCYLNGATAMPLGRRKKLGFVIEIFWWMAAGYCENP